MNVQSTTQDDAPDAEPDRLQGLAQLAFGSLTRADEMSRVQHLAMLNAESLELDLNDPLQRQFGDYELLEQIGEGGMGVVYRARHLPLDRMVAVKLLSAGPWASKDFIARFEREAQHAARMQHPNIVTVFEARAHEGMHFFSMRLIDGSSLSTLLKRGNTYTPKAAAGLMQTVAEAVSYAHSLGVLHLDLKPGNVLVDAAGVPHVADFGLARRLDSAAMVSNDEVSGTPSYMAPEQARVRSTHLSAATDVWGIGAILYELLTGAPPFRAATAQATLQLVQEAQVRAPRRTRPNLPLDLEAIVLRCLARDPRERYPSARALAEDLGRFVEGRPVQARPLNGMQRVARWTRREPKLAATLACAVAALVIGLVATSWQWHRARRNAVLAQASADVARHTLWKSRSDVAQTQMAKGDAYPALANVVANLRGMEANGDRSDAALERLRIGTVLANAPQLIDAIKLPEQPAITSLAISPDGQSVAVVTGRTVRLIDVGTGRQRWQVKTRPDSFGMTAFGLNGDLAFLHFSADGKRLTSYSEPWGPAVGLNTVLIPHGIDGLLIDAATGRQVAPPPQFADFLAVDYSNDGRYALLFDKHGDVQRWRTLPWTPDGELVHIDGLAAPTPDGIQLQDEALITDDGSTVVLVDPSKLRLRSFDAQHMRVRQTLTLTTDQDRATAWALRHDGKQLAIGTTTGQLAIWDLATGKATWLRARFNGWIGRLEYSRDDTRLLAVADAPGEMRVFDARSLQMVARPVVFGDSPDPNILVYARFGPDASTVLTRHATTGAIVWRIPDGGTPLQAPVPVAPPMVAMYARFALATDTGSQLMATADNQLLKLWRVRWTPYVGGRASPMVADTLHFDGRHLVSVHDNHVGVFDVTTGLPVGKTIALPEAPTYAGLDGSGTRLIAIAGRALSCWNWRNAKPCWPAIVLPDSPLRLGLAAHAPIMAVSTGSNTAGTFFEHVLVIDLATGRPRGAPVTVHGPLGALRLTDDGRRLLVFEYRGTIRADTNVVRVIDTASGRIVQNLVHAGKPQVHIIDARFADDGSIWILGGHAGWGEGALAQVWHWSAGGKLLGKADDDENGQGEYGMLTLPHGRGAIEVDSAIVFNGADVATATLAVPSSKNRVNTYALGPRGDLLALGTLVGGVGLYAIDRNQRLVPDFKLALPNNDVVQQLAFSPDGSRLIGRTMDGHWFEWRIVADARPVAAIEADLALRDFTALDKPVPPLGAGQRASLRAADPGPRPAFVLAPPGNAAPAAPLPNPRYQPLDIDPIANVDPRAVMNRLTKLPPRAQSFPTLPRGLQRYDGVDFLLGSAVQLSGTPLSMLNTEFPARSMPLRLPPQRIAAVDAPVFQFQQIEGEVGAVRLRYADGSERVLPILDGRDTSSPYSISASEAPVRPRYGWLASWPAGLHGLGFDNSGEAAWAWTCIVHLANPEPDRPVTAISFEAPPTASPGLLFLALTLEPESANTKKGH